VTSRKRSGKSIRRFLVDTNLFIAKTEVMDVAEKFLRLCKPYFPEDQLIDIYHAATCLQESAVLITNDRHFDRINEEKIIEVWSISKAIEEFGI